MTTAAQPAISLSNKARVERMPSGEVVVRDVPIFSEIRQGDPATKGPGGRPPIDEAWLQRAVDLHNARADLGHLPPLNLRHTFSGPKNVGKYRLRRVAKAFFNPQDDAPRATIFGDEIFPNEQAFEEAKDHPYRSPEISPDWPEEFGPLALLREASPYNKYPNLDLSNVDLSAVSQAFEARLPAFFAPQVFERGSSAFEVRGEVVHGIDPADLPRVKAGHEAMVAAKSGKFGTKEGSMPALASPATGGANGAPPAGANGTDMMDMLKAIQSHMAQTSTFMSKCYEALTGLNKGPGVSRSEGLEDGKDMEIPFGGNGQPVSGKPNPGKPLVLGAPGSDGTPDLEDGLKLPQFAAGPPVPPAGVGPDGKKKNDGIGSHEPPAVSSARNGAQFDARQQANGVSLVEFFSVKTQLEKLVREKDATGLCAQAERELASLGFASSMVEALRPQMFAAACANGKAGLDAVLAPARTMQQHFSAMPAPYASLGQQSRGVSGDPEDLAKVLQTFGARPGAADVIRSTYADYCSAPELQRLYSFEKICASDPRLNPNAGGRR